MSDLDIDSEFYLWQASKYKIHPGAWHYVYKEKSDKTRALVGRVFSDNEVELFKPKFLKVPEENGGLNWSIYWLVKKDGLYRKFEPANRINEIFEDPWSIYEFNALGYKTPNGTIVHYDSYLE